MDLGPFELDTIVVGDCLDIMRQMPDGCFSAVVTDPPYGVDVADWDAEVASQECLTECLRVSAGPVVWFGAAPVQRQTEILSYKPLPHRIYIWHNPFTRTHSDGAFWQYHPIYTWRRLKGLGRDVLRMVANSDGKKPVHPTQKPLALMEMLVRSSCSEGDIIFDPFMGSGTTAVAAKKLGRHYFGCDINPEYVELARTRVAKVDGVQLELLS